MPAIYEHYCNVKPTNIDQLGHVNNLVYLSWMIDAAVAHSKVQGWSQKEYQQIGFGWVVRSHNIEYLQPAFLENEIVVRTWVSDFRRIRSTRQYRIVRRGDGVLLATASTDWVWVSYTTWQPGRIPEQVVKSFEVVSDSMP
ncbi:acyl-CoA thioesterase [Pirellulaceae bacterium SH449]